MGKYNDWKDGDKTFLVTGILMLVFIIGAILKYNFISIAMLRTTKNIYFNMFNSIIRTPVVYFDKNPTGTILNRFTSDIAIMDYQLPMVLTDCLEGPMLFANLLITICVINPWIIIPGFVICCILYGWYIYCKPVILELKRLDLMHKSPVFSYFASTISGIL